MEIELTKAEKCAKDFVLKLLFKGFQQSEPCDENFTDEDFALPTWYDEKKFKSGQRFFQKNRSGIMTSNLYGLFSLISEPMGAKLLDSTNKSSTPETAKKRYCSTTLHMLSWYQDELKPGSRSWESMKKVRKMHQFASRASCAKGYMNISQTAMSMTAFGFMGYALIRPHLLGIHVKKEEDREDFVYFWAVIGSMLGIKDEFNMCLHPIDVVEQICHILNRYTFIPLLQLENPTFIKLGTAFIEGMRFYIPFSSFESRLFLARRLAGIPGYQYEVDMNKEYIIRQIFSEKEILQIGESFQNVTGHEYRKHMLFDENFYLLDINRIEKLKESDGIDFLAEEVDENIFGIYKDASGDFNNNEDCTETHWSKDIQEKLEFLGLQHPSELLVTKIDDDKMNLYRNDRYFHKLSKKDQQLVKYDINHMKNIDRKLTKPLVEGALSVILYIMKRNYS